MDFSRGMLHHAAPRPVPVPAPSRAIAVGPKGRPFSGQDRIARLVRVTSPNSRSHDLISESSFHLYKSTPSIQITH